MLAREAPSRRTPAMNALVPSTDEDSATATTRTTPLTPPRGASWPWIAASAKNMIAAPVETEAASTSGSIVPSSEEDASTYSA